MTRKETWVLSQGVKLTKDYLNGECTISELALENVAGRKAVCKWIDGYEAGGYQGVVTMTN